jgi:hypothetical protein
VPFIGPTKQLIFSAFSVKLLDINYIEIYLKMTSFK